MGRRGRSRPAKLFAVLLDDVSEHDDVGTLFRDHVLAEGHQLRVDGMHETLHGFADLTHMMLDEHLTHFDIELFAFRLQELLQRTRWRLAVKLDTIPITKPSLERLSLSCLILRDHSSDQLLGCHLDKKIAIAYTRQA